MKDAHSTRLPSQVQTYGQGAEWTKTADGVPFRLAARVVIFDAAGSQLLLRGHDVGQPERSWWFTVGGGLTDGEDSRQGAAREVREETGLQIDPGQLVGPVMLRRAVFDFAAITCRQDEDFYLLYLPTKTPSLGRQQWTDLEQQTLDELRWWSPEQLEDARRQGISFYPEAIIDFATAWWPVWDGNCQEVDERSLLLGE